MATIRITAEAPVGAEAPLVYRVLSDYRQHHPRILPAAFSHLVVEAGGVGAGTVITFKLRLFGRSYPGRAQVTEPEPGRILAESGPGITTRFIVEPKGPTSHVRVETDYEASGVAALVARLTLPKVLGRLYREELALLDAYARQLASAPSAG